MLQTLIQRYKDYQHERKIAQLRRQYDDAVNTQSILKIEEAFKAMAEAVGERSKTQVERMEKKYYGRSF